MKKTWQILTLSACMTYAPMVIAQEISNDQSSSPFTSENAILNTALPFVTEARESQQNLRGAFGWATFQEGYAENVYFRFDPDGYARFSPSPRLDTDVFEVTCRPRTYSCVGQKDAMALRLMDDGRIQLQLTDFRPTDQLFLYDGTTHIALPNRVVGAMEFQFETLLSAGGELEIQRGDMVVNKTSLKGFAATTAYLRWVEARQDYSVLPRNWPVPNSKNDPQGTSLAASAQWTPPTSDSEAIGQVASGAQYAEISNGEDLQDIRAELERLTNMLSEPTASVGATPSHTPQGVETETTQGLENSVALAENSRLQDLENQLALLTAELSGLRSQDAHRAAPITQQSTSQMYPAPVDPVQWRRTTPDAKEMAPMPAQALPDEVRHLQYLVAEMGLTPKTALVLMQFIKPEDGERTVQETAITRSYHDTLANTILEDLENDLAATMETNNKATPMPEEIEPSKKSADNVPLTPTSQLQEQADVQIPVIAPAVEPQVVAEAAVSKSQPDKTSTEFLPLSEYLNSVSASQ